MAPTLVNLSGLLVILVSVSIKSVTAANCTGVVCNNGGVCNSYTASPPCICPLPYIPPYCSAAANYCSTPQPDKGINELPVCQNGGNCTMTYTDPYFNCSCQSGYTGFRCNETATTEVTTTTTTATATTATATATTAATTTATATATTAATTTATTTTTTTAVATSTGVTNSTNTTMSSSECVNNCTDLALSTKILIGVLVSLAFIIAIVLAIVCSLKTMKKSYSSKTSAHPRGSRDQLNNATCSGSSAIVLEPSGQAGPAASPGDANVRFQSV